MSETRYTPEQMREMADALASMTAIYPHWGATYLPSAAMLRQAATDAEALAAKDAELRKRSDVTTAQTIALTKLGDEYANEFNRAESLQASLTAERQKVRELREYLDNEIAVAIKCDEQAANTADANWFRGKAEGYAWAVKRMDALGLTGDATEGQG